MKQLYVPMFVFVLAIVAGCGGGTSGTDGGGTLSFQGVLQESDGTPITGALVTLMETGDSATSRGDGSFVIDTASVETAEFLIEKSGSSTSVRIATLPENEGEIHLSIRVDFDAGIASVDFISVTPRTATPAPTAAAATPAPTRIAEKPRSELRGNILDEAAKPLAGATVRIEGVSQSARTSSKGTFTLQFPAGAPEIRVVVTSGRRTGRVIISVLPSTAVSVVVSIVVKKPADGVIVNSEHLDLRVTSKKISKR